MTTLRALLLSFCGLVILVLTLIFYGSLPDLVGKLLLLLGCMVFGYGIAYIIVEQKTPR